MLNLLKLLTFDYKWNTFFSYIYQPFLSLFQWVYIFCQIFYSSIDVFIFLLFIYKISLYRKNISLLSTMCFVGGVCVFWNLIFDVSKNSIHLLGGISVCYSTYLTLRYPEIIYSSNPLIFLLILLHENIYLLTFRKSNSSGIYVSACMILYRALSLLFFPEI